jgi:hypothetical protein
MSTLRIMSHNCHGMTPSKFQNIISLINTSYDIIFIQEHWFTNFYNSTVISHPTFFNGSPPPSQKRTIGHENGGLCILMDPKLRFHCKLLHSSESLIILQAFSSINIATTYLPFRLPLSFIDNFFPPCIAIDLLVGDFNFHLLENYSKRNTETTKAKAIFRTTLSKGLQWTTPNYNFENGSQPSGPDHCFLNPDKIKKIFIDYRPIEEHSMFSDHGLFKIEFQVPFFTTIPTEFTTKRFYIRKLRNDTTSRLFSSLFDNRWNTNCFLSVNQFDLALRSTIKMCAEKSLGSYLVQEIKVKSDHLLDQIGMTQDPQENIMLFKRSNRGQQVILESSDPSKTALNEATLHYQKIWNCDDKPPVFLETTPTSLGNCEISPLLIRKCIISYPNSRSCGADSIHILMLKSLLRHSTKFLSAITALFNLCVNQGKTPTEWNKSITNLLSKTKENRNVKHTRPISLTLMIRRIFEICLLRNWESLGNEWTKLNRWQAGSRKHYSTMTHLLCVDELSKTGYHFTSLLDLRKAFDSVPHRILQRKLQDRNIPSTYLILIESLFLKNMQTQLVVNGMKSVPIKIQQGIMQGCPMSPLLFNIFIDDLASELEGKTLLENGTALFYLDDICLKSKNQATLQSMLIICHNWSIKNKINFNIEKSFIIGEHSLKFTLGNHLLPTSHRQKYLGAPLQKNGIDWIALFEKQFQRAINLLGFLELKGKAWTEISRFRIYQTFCLSQFNYCVGPIYELMKNRTDKKQFETKLNYLDERVLKFIFGTQFSRPKSVLQWILMFPSTWSRFEYLHSRAVIHVRNSHTENPIHVLKDAAFGNTLPLFSIERILPRMFLSTNLILKKEKRYQQLSIKEIWMNDFITNMPKNELLFHYISEESRKKAFGPDRVLFISDNTIRNYAIEWRRNLLGYRKQCIVCKNGFTRNHMERCLLSQLPTYVRPIEELMGDFISKKNELNQKGITNFTILDYLLNTQSFDLFHDILNACQLL